MKLLYAVKDRESGNEDPQVLETTATTPNGWLRVFYSRWPTAPRGRFYATVYDGRTDITSWDSGRIVASFVLLD